MKKLLIILVIVIILAGIGIGIGLGRGKGSGEGDGNSTVEKTQEEESKKDMETEEQSKKADSKNEDLVLAITVVESDYFYENERITLEDFFSELQEVQGEYIVQVKDDNASLKAYNNLIDELEEQKIDYVEK